MKHFYTNSLMNRPNTERRTLGNENQQNRYGKTHAFSIRNIAAIVIMLLVVCLGGTVWGQTTINMQNGSRSLNCGDRINFYDDGGSGSNYATSRNLTYTFSSTTGPISINFSQFATESTGASDWDNIKIYDGTVATGTPLVFGCSGWTNGFNGAAAGFQNLLNTGITYTCYSGTMTVVWKSDGSTTAAGWTATIECGFKMTNGLIANMECGRSYCFYDDGGVSGNYSTSQNQTAIFRTNGNIVINFSQFATESTGASDWDNIKIYDGDITTGRKLVFGCTGWSSGLNTGAASGFANLLTTGTNYTCTSGIMTVVWKSDGSNTAAGWQATITTNNCCTTRPGIFTFNEENVSVAAGEDFTQAVTNTTGTSGVTYSIAPAGIATINATTGRVVTTAGQYGTVTITATIPANGSYCSSTASYNLDITDCENSIILNRNLTRNIECGKSYCFYDSGINNNYGNNEGYTATFTSTGTIHIIFESALQGENSYDYMSIDGITTTVSNVASIAAGTEYVSSAVGGSVTVRWRSDGSGQYNGWKAIITATGCGPSPTYTCEGPATERTIAIGDNYTTTYNYHPVNNLYNYTYKQIIYTHDEIGDAGVVKAIGFRYYSTTPMTDKNNVTIYMANTSTDAFTNNTSWITTGLVEVYTGRFNFTQPGWAWIPLSTEFNYDGTNLLVVIDDNSGDYNSGTYFYYNNTATPNRQIYYRSDSYNYGNDNISGVTATGYDGYRPQTKFCIETSCTPRSASITNCPGTMTSGASMTLNGTVSAGAGSVSWSSSSSSVEINESTGAITARTPGQAIITYSRGANGLYCGATYNCTITVSCATNTQTFAFNTTTGSVAEDATLNIAGYLTVPTGATVTSYTSANTSIATVTNAGVVTGVSSGTTTITATIAQWTASNGVTYCARTTTNSFTVTVTSDCDESFNLSGNMTKTINCGTTYCFYDSGGKSGSYSNNEDFTATFTSAGIIHMEFISFEVEANYDKFNVTGSDGNDGIHDGTSLLGAELISSTGSITINFKSDNSVTRSGWKVKITATGCCTQRTGDFEFCRTSVNATTSTPDFTVPLTNTVTPAGTVSYTSSNPGVATVDATGTVHPIANGTTTITATIPAATISGTDYCAVTANYVVMVGTPGGNEGCDDIGTGTNSDADGLGITTLYQYAWVEMIYTADELNLGSGCSITSIAFRVDGANSEMTEPQSTKIYIGLTDKSQFDDDYDFVSPAGGVMTIVYNGTWTLHDGWNVFTFNTPFAYTNNTKNLIVGVLCLNDDYWCTDYIYYTESPNRLIQAYEDDYVPDPENMGSYYGYMYVLNLRPNIRICTNCTFIPTEFPSVSLSPDETQIVCKTSDVASAINDITVTSVGETVTLTPSDKGLSYSTLTHKITGIPNFTGTQEFNITVKDADDCLKDEKTFTITVNQLDATIEITNP